MATWCQLNLRRQCHWHPTCMQLRATFNFTIIYWAVFSISISLNNLTYWQLNLGVVSRSPLWVWHTPVCPSIAWFQRFYCHRENAGGEVILHCEPALTGHFCTTFSVVTHTEGLPVIDVLWWIGTPHSYLTAHGATQFLWLYTAPVC